MTNKMSFHAGVLGWPVKHSLSPRVHGYWLKKYGIDGTYKSIAVKPENFVKTLHTLADDGFIGVNVTVPHKEIALSCMDKVDAQARRIGAVNTVIICRDGSLSGQNTDGFGFLENLRSNTQGVSSVWRTKSVAIIGAGGAARAVCAALIDDGVAELRLINRTCARAEALATDIGGPVKVIPWQQRSEALDGVVLLVNTTTLGMTGKAALDLDISCLPTKAIVNDIVYAPLQTPLLKNAARRGNLIVDGLGMLLHQARPGFAAWFGVKPEVTIELRDFVLQGMN